MISEGGLSVPFIQFDDDSLFLLKAELEGLKNLRCILFMVEATTGLKVNWGKMTLSPIGNVHEMEDMENILGCDMLP